MTKFGHKGSFSIPVPQIFGDLLHTPTRCMTNSDQILHGDQTRWEEIFYRANCAPFLPKGFCDPNADVQSVCCR